jgi:hypothetical protein
MTTDFKLRNGHRTRALSHAVSLIHAQACKPLCERRSRLLSDIVHCVYQIGAIASKRYKGFDELALAGLAEKTSELSLGALSGHLLGYVEVAHIPQHLGRVARQLRPTKLPDLSDTGGSKLPSNHGRRDPQLQSP